MIVIKNTKLTVLVCVFVISFGVVFYKTASPPHKSIEPVGNLVEHASETPETKVQVTEQKLSTSIQLDELSLQELASIVDSSYFNNTPWLNAKVAYALAKFDLLQLQEAYHRLLNSKISGSYKLLNLVVLSMAAHSNIDTLEFLLRQPSNRVTSNHFSLVFNDASNKNSIEIAEWVLSKDYYSEIAKNQDVVAKVFQKVAEQSLSTAQSYLPRAHVHLKQHILHGLMNSFENYQQFQLLIDYMSVNEHKVLNQLVMNTMAAKYPSLTAQWLTYNPNRNFEESVYLNIFKVQVKEDFEKAANWYFQNSPDTKTSLIKTILFRGSEGQSPESLLRWAQNLPTEYHDYAIGELLSWQVDDNIDFVLQHYSKVQNAGQRYKISIRAFHQIQRETPEFLDEFIAQSEFSDTFLERLARKEANRL